MIKISKPYRDIYIIGNNICIDNNIFNIENINSYCLRNIYPSSDIKEIKKQINNNYGLNEEWVKIIKQESKPHIIDFIFLSLVKENNSNYIKNIINEDEIFDRLIVNKKENLSEIVCSFFYEYGKPEQKAFINKIKNEIIPIQSILEKYQIKFNHYNFDKNSKEYIAKNGTDKQKWQIIKSDNNDLKEIVAIFGSDEHKKYLLKDKNIYVKAKLAEFGSDEIRWKLINDRSPYIRAIIARLGTDEQRKYLLKKEKNTEVLYYIFQFDKNAEEKIVNFNPKKYFSGWRLISIYFYTFINKLSVFKRV